jgi:malate synthase
MQMAAVVDRQNAETKGYAAMAPDFANSIPFQAALALVLQGTSLPSGYTEPVLHPARVLYKAQQQKK